MIYFQTSRWDDPDAYIWDNAGLRALYIIQRTGMYETIHHGFELILASGSVTATCIYIYRTHCLLKLHKSVQTYAKIVECYSRYLQVNKIKSLKDKKT